MTIFKDPPVTKQIPTTETRNGNKGGKTKWVKIIKIMK